MSRGIFNRVQVELDVRESQEGITATDLLDLPEELRRIVNHITRKNGRTLSQIARRFNEEEEDVRKLLSSLVEKGFVVETELHGEPFFKVYFARKRGRKVPIDVWSAVEGKFEAKEEEEK
jgi:hypothetical protein